MEKLTESELRHLQESLKYIHTDRRSQLRGIEEVFKESEEQLILRFENGIDHHEVKDRSRILVKNIDLLLCSHGSVATNEEAYRLAYLARALLEKLAREI